jgi:alcohol dehydrogenase (cytochrome c)
MWTTGSYDVGQRTTIWGTGQPQPMHDPEFRPGDNLFSNSAIALDLDTGKLKWYFQYTPNESWDYDEQGVHMLIDATVNGQPRKLVSHYGRNGFFYNLDRTNGSFITAGQYVDVVNWTKGIDPKTGKPIEYDPNVALQAYIPSTRMLRGETNNPPACPHKLGGVRWQPPSYNPTKHVAYSAGIDGCYSLDVIPVLARPDGGIDPAGPGARVGRAQTATYLKNVDVHGLLSAVDVTTGQVVARLRQPYENLSGMLATGGGLVFSATLDGAVTAHDDETLAELWRFETGISIKAAPFSYAIGGKQFIAIMVGGPAPGGAIHPELKEMIPGGMMYVFSL